MTRDPAGYSAGALGCHAHGSAWAWVRPKACPHKAVGMAPQTRHTTVATSLGLPLPPPAGARPEPRTKDQGQRTKDQTRLRHRREPQRQGRRAVLDHAERTAPERVV